LSNPSKICREPLSIVQSQKV